MRDSQSHKHACPASKADESGNVATMLKASGNVRKVKGERSLGHTRQPPINSKMHNGAFLSAKSCFKTHLFLLASKVNFVLIIIVIVCYSYILSTKKSL